MRSLYTPLGGVSGGARPPPIYTKNRHNIPLDNIMPVDTKFVEYNLVRKNYIHIFVSLKLIIMRRKDSSLIILMLTSKVPIIKIARKLRYRINNSFDMITDFWSIPGQDGYWDTLQQVKAHISNSKYYYKLLCPFDIYHISENKVASVVHVRCVNNNIKYSSIIKY